MQINLKHVQQRGNAFFFRLAIPDNLQQHFHGKREITQTLQTTDPYTAFTKSEQLTVIYKDKFQSLRAIKDRDGEPLPPSAPWKGGFVGEETSENIISQDPCPVGRLAQGPNST